MSGTKDSGENKNQFYDIKYELVTLGISLVGKYSLITRYTKSQTDKGTAFSNSIDVQSKIIQIQTKKIKIEIINTLGQERFRSIPR